MEAKLSESEDKAKDLTTELEAAQEKIEKAAKKSDEAEGSLEEIKKDRATELRMKELEEAGVVSDEEAQSGKVREMSDEDFVASDKLFKLLVTLKIKGLPNTTSRTS